MSSVDPIEPSPLTFLGSNQRLARRVARPVARFLHIEAAGGIVLLVGTVVALVWANSPWSDSYHEILETHIRLSVGDLYTIDLPVEAWINDALMALFFFVVGIEIKRELVAGELRNPRAAALPAVAAVGGMVVPALVFTAFNFGHPGEAGWGIPMATDIAFALGVVSLLGNRVPSTMKVFLLTLAIVDDIGAIAVIAIFYTSDLSLGWLLVAVALIGLVVAMRLARIWYIPAYVFVGIFVWIAVFESGVHATIAGVVLGLLTPALPLKDGEPSAEVEESIVERAVRGEADVHIVRRASFELREKVSVAERINVALHPYTSFVIIPIFALANAGIELSGETVEAALTARVTAGVFLGLVVGKLVGVSLATWLGVRSGLSTLPRGASWTHVVGLASIAGIGFTVSLFVTGLAYDDLLSIEEAKIGILSASLVAAVVGSVILTRAHRVVEVDIDDPVPT